MQAKIIDYASDKLVNALHKIDKKDVQKVMNSVAGKSKKQDQQTTSNNTIATNKVTSSEEYCAMLKSEFDFENELKDKRALEMNHDMNFKNDNTDNHSKSASEKNYEKIDMSEYGNNESSGESTGGAACKPDQINRQFSNEVQSFVQKKNIAQGMMDLALLSSNCNQLRYVLDMNALHPYYLTSLTLIGISLLLQITVGLGLLYSNNYNLKRKNEMRSASQFSTLSIIGVFFITIINVLIATFNGTNISSDVSRVKPDNMPLTTTEDAPMMQVQDDVVVLD